MYRLQKYIYPEFMTNLIQFDDQIRGENTNIPSFNALAITTLLFIIMLF